MYDKIFPPKKIVLPNGKVVLEKRSRVPLILLIVLIAIYYSAQVTGFNFEAIYKRIDQFFVIIIEMLKPNWHYFDNILPELIVTLKMSFFGSVAGAIVALPIAVLASANIIKNKAVVGVSKTDIKFN